MFSRVGGLVDLAEVMPILGSRVRALRTRQGLSARELAEACADAGMPSLTRVAVAKIESGYRRTTIEEVGVLAGALGVTVADLVSHELLSFTRLFG